MTLLFEILSALLLGIGLVGLFIALMWVFNVVRMWNIKRGLTPKGERMPQTPEEFAYMAERYEEALLRKKKEISRLRERINKLEQKLSGPKATVD